MAGGQHRLTYPIAGQIEAGQVVGHKVKGGLQVVITVDKHHPQGRPPLHQLHRQGQSVLFVPAVVPPAGDGQHVLRCLPLRRAQLVRRVHGQRAVIDRPHRRHEGVLRHIRLDDTGAFHTVFAVSLVLSWTVQQPRIVCTDHSPRAAAQQEVHLSKTQIVFVQKIMIHACEPTKPIQHALPFYLVQSVPQQQSAGVVAVGKVHGLRHELLTAALILMVVIPAHSGVGTQTADIGFYQQGSPRSHVQGRAHVNDAP